MALSVLGGALFVSSFLSIWFLSITIAAQDDE